MSARSSEKVVIVEPSRGYRSLDPREIWAFRGLFVALVRRDVALRYRQTVLGLLWVAIRPLLSILVLAVVFGRIVRVPSEGWPYPVFVLAGFLPWAFFAQGLTGTANSVVASAHLLTKVYFPRLILPFVTIASGIPDFLIGSAVMVALLVHYGLPFSSGLLAVPLVLAATLFVTTSAGIFVAALNVAYRDVSQVIPFVVQLWLYASPVIYPTGLVPPGFRWLLYLNPMSGVIDASRAAFLGGTLDGRGLLTSLATAAVVLVLALDFFRRVDVRVADIV